MSEFFRRVEEKIKETGAFLCVGLDPRREEMSVDEQDMLSYDPTIGLVGHGQRIFEATRHVASSWKINLAFYEAWGSAGWSALESIVPMLSQTAPVILDGKRGDIDTTAESYAHAAVKLGAHAVTVSPYLGRDSVLPFIKVGLDVLMLVRTSNSSASDIQDQPAAFPTWKRVLEDSMLWSTPDQLGFVVAANDKLTLEKVRDIAPNRWMLSPGVGAQGANIRDVIEASSGTKLIIPISRAISGSADPNIAATKFAEEMRTIRSQQANKKKRASFSVKERVAYDLFDRGCVKFGQFKLKSGAISPIYVDLRMLVAHPDLLAQIAELYKEELRNKSFDALAALPYAALPIGTAISLSMNKPMLYPRKEQKSYGTCSLIEGEYKKGIKAVVIDDVVTKGDSKLEVIQVLETNGIVVDEVCVLIDREGGGREVLETRGKKLISIFKFSELLDAWHLSERITQEQYESVSHFLGGT